MRVLLAMTALASSCGQTATSPKSGPPGSTGRTACKALRAEIEARLGSLLVEPGYPSIAVGVVSGGRPAYTVVAGVADRGTAAPATADTQYQIGSVSKMFVGLLAARLEVAGEVDLDTPLSAAFPDVTFARDAGGITLRQLATHTGGVPRYPDNLERVDGEPMLGYPPAAMRAALASLAPETAPGTAFSYSNFGYGILGEALSNLAGAPLPALLDREVLAPLGLEAVGFTADPARLAVPYRDDDPRRATRPWDMGALAGAGGLYASIDELTRFAAAEVAPPAELAPAYAAAGRTRWSFGEGRANGYGLGRFLVDSRSIGAYLSWHGGDIDGYAATLMAAPDQGVAVAVLTNAGIGRPIGELGNWLIERAIDACEAH